MNNMKILLKIDNRFIKSILLKSIGKAGLSVLDVLDRDDMHLKLEAFGETVVLAVTEITKENLETVKAELACLRAECPQVPVLALVFKDTSEIVSFSISAGIKDVLLLPKTNETYAKLIQSKMEGYYTKFNRPEPIKEPVIFEKIQQSSDTRKSLDIELKRAMRGEYPISFVMAYLSSQNSEGVKSALLQSVKAFMRDTDKLVELDEDTIIGVFPFTAKSNVPIIEDKFRDSFKSDLSSVGLRKKLCLFSATYPDDGATIEALLERMVMGINNSMLINSVQAPLNELSRNELEDYKKKIRQYKRFFKY